jgi:hypothetical protein
MSRVVPLAAWVKLGPSTQVKQSALLQGGTSGAHLPSWWRHWPEMSHTVEMMWSLLLPSLK